MNHKEVEVLQRSGIPGCAFNLPEVRDFQRAGSLAYGGESSRLAVRASPGARCRSPGRSPSGARRPGPPRRKPADGAAAGKVSRPIRRHDTITLSAARSRLDQRRFSCPNTHFSAVFKIYKKINFSQADLQKFCESSQNLQNFVILLARR